MLKTPPREDSPLGEEAPPSPVPPSDPKTSRATELLSPDKWPTPRWFVEKKTKNIQTYDEHFALQLRAKYVELENEFRSVLGNFPCSDPVTAARISDILHSVRQSLEQESTELLTVSCALDLIERYMVWLYPPYVAQAKICGLLFKLQSLSIKGRDFLIEQVTNLTEGEAYRGQIPSVLDETIGAINTQIIQDRIGSSLQINRLRALRTWGLIVLLIFWAASPLAISLKIAGDWPSQLFIEKSPALSTWMNAFAMMLLGAVGGFLSGLLQARSTRVSLTEYLENMIKLQLRPLIGALVALILYTFLSWQVLPGITIVNAGSYFLIAFLSGFSERYFLQLLKTKPEESGEVIKAEVTTSEVIKTQVTNNSKQTNLTGL